MSELTAFVRAYPPATPPLGADALWLAFRGGDLLVTPKADGSVSLPRGPVGDIPALYLGTLNGVPVLATEAETASNDGAETVGLRALYGRLSDDEYTLALYATHLLHWQRNSAFCLTCGATLESLDGGWGKTCTAPGKHTIYPLVSPAVLVLVYDDAGRVLLARKPGWGKRYSILAGFTEPGESLEGCVAREVAEEVGISVTDITYQGSQPWPFPHQIMIGFTARATGENLTAESLTLDTTELEHADWFTPDALPDLPPPLSLSRQIIDKWVAAQ